MPKIVCLICLNTIGTTVYSVNSQNRLVLSLWSFYGIEQWIDANLAVSITTYDGTWRQWNSSSSGCFLQNSQLSEWFVPYLYNNLRHRATFGVPITPNASGICNWTVSSSSELQSNQLDLHGIISIQFSVQTTQPLIEVRMYNVTGSFAFSLNSTFADSSSSSQYSFIHGPSSHSSGDST